MGNQVKQIRNNESKTKHQKKTRQRAYTYTYMSMSAYALSILRSLVFSFCAYTSQGEKYTNEKRDITYNTHTDAFPHVFGTCACMYVNIHIFPSRSILA